jgi:CRISPR/Cas system-associated exonuclease Cas4 (RecB family)
MGIWLSYSAYKQYKTCPKQYYLKRVKKDTPPEEDSRHNAAIGTVVMKVFEDFYNEEIWRKGAKTSDELLARAELYFWEFVENEYIDWDDFSCRFSGPTEVLDEILVMVPKVLAGIKREKFLGPYAKSEIDIKVRFGMEDYLLGYLDFVIRTPEDELLLLDGKASRHREKNVDETQLYYYALMFYLRYKKLPDRMGFFYFNFADDPELAMDWIDVDRAKIRDLRRDIEQVIYEIKQGKKGRNKAGNFPAKPQAKNCRYCLWESVCGERLQQKAANSKKRSKNKPKIEADFGDNGTAVIGFDALKGGDGDA